MAHRAAWIFFFFSFFHFSLGQAQSNATFSPGQAIATAGSSSAISTATFSFGFAPSRSTPNRFDLGIWYRADASQFLVWRAAGPASAPGSTLDFSNGTLAVRDAQSLAATWTAGVTGPASSGELQASGNLVLSNSTDQIVWSSFDHPGSTLLPGQFLVTGRNLSVDSYSVAMDLSGNLTLRWNNVAYWSSDTASGNSSSTPNNAVMDVNGVLNLNATTTTVVQFFPEDYGPGFTRRLTLDNDGNLRLYTLTPPAEWTARWQAVSDQCQVYNYCGNYGICSHRAVRPTGYAAVCDCPVGLAFSDPALRRGCTGTGNVARDCANGNNRLIASNTTAWLDSGSTVTSNSNIEQCTSNCRDDSSCFGCLFPNDGSGRCVQFRSSSMSGFSSPAIQSTAFLKVCSNAANAPPTSPREAQAGSTDNGRTIGVAVAVTLAAVALVELAMAFFVYRRRYRKRAQDAARHAILDYASGTPIRFTYKELQKATYNFQTKIGQGGFGAVYKGSIALPVEMTAIAVKKLEGIFQGEKEFRTEVATIGSTHHMNLMRLVGFCTEGSDTRLLVYEFLPHGSLDRFLFHHDHDLAPPQDHSEWFDETSIPMSAGQAEGFQSKSGRRDYELSRSGPSRTSHGLEPAFPSRSGNISSSGPAFSSRSTDISETLGQEPPKSIDASAAASTTTSRHTARSISGGANKPPSLDWPTRFKVALGTARALAYLHEECRHSIVHCDLKPENILLDNSFSPKVSDFGLARLIQEGNTRNLTTVRGTRGYLAPEWLANLPITAKSDVYSYGMVLLELVGGRRNYDACSAVPRGRQRYPVFLYHELGAGRVEEAVDERLYRADLDGEELERVVKVAFWCIQDAVNARPVMSKVVQMLEGGLPVLFPPPPKAAMDSSSSSSSTTAANSSTGQSITSSGLSSLTSGR